MASLRQLTEGARSARTNEFVHSGRGVFLILLIFIVSLSQAFAQNKTDSLFRVFKTAKHDTTRINIYNALSSEYKSSNPDTAIYFAHSALKLGIKANYKKGISNTYNRIGIIHMYKGDYDQALEFYFKSLKIAEDILNEAKELSEKQDAQEGMSTSYNNIGIIHAQKGDYDQALDFFLKSLQLVEELGDKNGMANSYNNVGLIHKKEGDYDQAIDFYFKSLKISEELGDKNGMANSYNNIGSIYSDKGDSQLDKEIQRDEYNQALDFYFKSLQLFEEIGDKNSMAASYNNIGSLYLMQGKPKEAKEQQLLALNIALEIGAKPQMYFAYNSLAQCDSALGNFRGAYEYHKLYSQIHDIVFSKESDEKIAEMGAKYEVEKRELTIQKLEKEKLLQDETLARKEAESKKQRILLFSFLAGFLLILVFSIFLYRLFVQKKMANSILQQQKEEISTQKDEIESQRDLVTQQKEKIEEKQKEILDSIRYAKRIQEALLTSQTYIERNINRLKSTK